MGDFCPYLWVFPGIPGKKPSETPSTGENEPLTAAMRTRTRAVHDKSDKMVNLRLAFLFADRGAYGTALSHFYFVFLAIERNIAANGEHRAISRLGDLVPTLSRADRVLEDVRHFLGEDWKPDIKTQPKEVQDYVTRLDKLGQTDPTLLLPYAYHMYMAILSGGQMIRRLARRAMALPDGRGVRALEFGKGKPAAKRALRSAVDAVVLSRKAREAVLDESARVFQMNNEIVRAVRVPASCGWAVARCTGRILAPPISAGGAVAGAVCMAVLAGLVLLL